MAFPTLEATGTFSDTGNGTTHEANLPAPAGGILADDLLIAFVSMDAASSSQTISWPDGTWNEILDTTFGSSVNVACAWKRAAGGESGTITVTTSASQGGGIRIFCVRGGHTTDVPELVSAAAGSTNPDPPSLNPANWDVEDTLWIAAAGNDGNVAITAADGDYSDFGNTRWANANGAGIATAWLQSAVASEDPAVFTMASEQWVACTVAVRPASGSTERRGRVAWIEAETPTAPRRGRVSFAELQVADAPRRGFVAWVEAQTPDVAHRGRVSWAELEVATAPRRVLFSFAEAEAPDAPRRGRASWAELETPDAPGPDPRRGLVTWVEVEAPTAPRRGWVSFGEFETPTAPRLVRVSFAEMEAPVVARRVFVLWAEMEMPEPPAQPPPPPATYTASIGVVAHRLRAGFASFRPRSRGD